MLIRAGRIEQVGPSVALPELPEACVIDAEGRVVTAGLWNTHVHFSGPAFAAPSVADAVPEFGDTSRSQLREMLLRYGFTGVMDAGSVPPVIAALRRAIRAGEIDGPQIVMASGGFVYRDGAPIYLPKGLLPEISDAERAPAAVEAVLGFGADGIKIFSGSFQGVGKTVLLPPEIIRAITREAHARDAFVVSHPTSGEGFANAVENGVDILAHTAPEAGRIAVETWQHMREREIALIPTLKLFGYEARRAGRTPEATAAFQQLAVDQLSEAAAAGVEILFGTDVGYMEDWDPKEEYELMQRAGLDFADILRSLTTAPARRFERGSGKIEPGEIADLVIFTADPREDAANFARVAVSLREGRVVYRSASPSQRSEKQRSENSPS